MTAVDGVVIAFVVVGLVALIAFALRSNAKAHGDGRGEA